MIHIIYIVHGQNFKYKLHQNGDKRNRLLFDNLEWLRKKNNYKNYSLKYKGNLNWMSF